MSEAGDELHIAVMSRGLAQIAEYINGLDEDGFLSRRVIVDAVALNLLVVGEAASRLSTELKAAVPAPWREIVSLRHRIAHDYLGMSADRLWLTASDSAPELQRLIRRWLESC